MKHFRGLLAAIAFAWLSQGLQAQTLSTRPVTNDNAGTGAPSRTGTVDRSAVPTFSLDIGDNQNADTDRQGTANKSQNFGSQRKATTPDQTQPSTDSRRPMRKRANEFSRYATKIAGQPLSVFGGDFFNAMSLTATSAGSPVGPAVPADYLVNAGDELLIQISGPYEAEFKQQVRRGGDITLPRVGTVRVAGVTAGELSSYLKSRMETQFKNIQVSASFASLHGMRVYVTGFVESPGPQVVDSISSITSAIAAAGGPSEGGSYRIAELWRKGQKIATFDLYDLLVKGDRSKDMGLTAEDTVRVAPSSSFQVALTGSVNRPAVYELLPQEGLTELLAFAGGFTPVADRSRLAVVLINVRGQREVIELPYKPAEAVRLSEGSVLHVFSSASLDPAINSTSKIVHVEGEVKRPGSYVLPAISKIADAIEAAGGATPDAYLKGLTLTRASLAREQSLRLQASLDEMERSVFEASATVAANTGESGAAASLANAAVKTYIDRLRQIKPIGRLVMARSQSGALAIDPVVEDGDRISVPPKPTSVSVFGAVYGEGSYLAQQSGPLSTFLKVAGGTRPGADLSSLFILKADGTVQSAASGWFSSELKTEVDPGDAIFVPTDAQRGRYWAVAKDVGTLLYQFGLGAAAIKTLR